MSPTRENSFSRLPGFTLIELLVVFLILTLVYSFVVLAIKPGEIRQKAHDVVRISDINKFSAAIEAYISDRGFPPDNVNTTRTSIVSLSFGSPSLSNGQGWIGEDLSKYLEKLPLDPINVNPYFYRYRHNGVKYEIDALLEFYYEAASKDSGNDSLRYERGTDLTIL